MTIEAMAEAIERARYAMLRHDRWEDLREAERLTRVEHMVTALERAAVGPLLADLSARAGKADDLESAVAAGEAALRREVSAHDAEIVRLADRIAVLEAERDAACGERDAAQARAAQAEDVLATVRLAVAPQAAVPSPQRGGGEAGPGATPAAETAGPAIVNPDHATVQEVAAPAPRGRFARLARA